MRIEQVKINILRIDKTLKLPAYESLSASGMDLMASFYSEIDGSHCHIKIFRADGSKEELDENQVTSIQLNKGDRALIPTGIILGLPEGYEMQIRPRSGLALKHGITVLNSPGTIDADYRGAVGVILINHGVNPFTINHGDRIAQGVIAKSNQYDWDEVNDINQLGITERGIGGYGHTGK